MIIKTLIVAFLVSFFGSIPPGTINISVMQLAILGKKRAAIFFSLAAVLVEFVYAWITVQFHFLLTNNDTLGSYFRIITASALIILGLVNLFSKSTSKSVQVDEQIKGRHGFMKGLVMGLLNPMTIPFWLTITTYLEDDGLINVDGLGLWMYLIGLAAGTFCLLLLVDALGGKFKKIADNTFITHRLPGFLLLGLGIYFLIKLVI